MALRTVTQLPLKKSMACQTDSNLSSSRRDNTQYGAQQPILYSRPNNGPVNGYLQQTNPNFLPLLPNQNFQFPMPNLVPIIPNPNPAQPQLLQQFQGQQAPAVNNYGQPPINQSRGPVQCHNCKRFGHRFKDCRQPQSRLFCYKCGMENVITENCPFCNSGNGL
jgi:hypothetical protein